jgi:hypothetical protein
MQFEIVYQGNLGHKLGGRNISINETPPQLRGAVADQRLRPVSTVWKCHPDRADLGQLLLSFDEYQSGKGGSHRVLTFSPTTPGRNFSMMYKLSTNWEGRQVWVAYREVAIRAFTIASSRKPFQGMTLPTASCGARYASYPSVRGKNGICARVCPIKCWEDGVSV